MPIEARKLKNLHEITQIYGDVSVA